MSTRSSPPASVVIIGRPNVGKSALFNRLARRSIAIVHDQPGITRDRISATAKVGSKPFTIWDTGGVVGAGESELTDQVRNVAEQAMKTADLVLFVVDGRTGLQPPDLELARLVRRSRKPVILTVNKIDHEKAEDLASDFAGLGFDQLVTVSAAHGRNIGELTEEIEKRLPDTLPNEPGEESREESVAIAVVGRPNAGKSSFINAVLNDSRTIVSDLPGTTRDAVDIHYVHEGQQFVFIDTAGIRRRGSHSSSVEVFSVMRAERSIRRADMCILMVDLTSGVTAQDKRIAGMIQESRRPCLIVLNKWDLVKPARGARDKMAEVVEEARERVFFLPYAPVLVSSALTGESIERVFSLIRKMQMASRRRIGTGPLNRAMQSAFAANPPPMVSGRRLKLFYAAQSSGSTESVMEAPEFILFVNDPKLLADTYGRYLEAQIRGIEPYPGLPILLRTRARQETKSHGERRGRRTH